MEPRAFIAEAHRRMSLRNQRIERFQMGRRSARIDSDACHRRTAAASSRRRRRRILDIGFGDGYSSLHASCWSMRISSNVPGPVLLSKSAIAAMLRGVFKRVHGEGHKFLKLRVIRQPTSDEIRMG
jgi:hypothetical protein